MRHRNPSSYRQLEQEHDDSQPLTTRCLICGWYWAGSALAAREKATQHREKAHPEVGPYRQPPRKRLSTFREHKMSDEDINEVQAERRKRAFLAGVDIDERHDVF